MAENIAILKEFLKKEVIMHFPDVTSVSFEKDENGAELLVMNVKGKEVAFECDDIFTIFQAGCTVENVLDILGKVIQRFQEEYCQEENCSSETERKKDIRSQAQQVIDNTHALIVYGDAMDVNDENISRDFFGEKVVYVIDGTDETAPEVINKQFLEDTGMTENQLYAAVLTGMKKRFPPVLKAVDELGYQTLEGVPSPYVLTTQNDDVFGATAMLYQDVLKDISEKFDDDLLIAHINNRCLLYPVKSIGDIDNFLKFMNVVFKMLNDIDDFKNTIYNKMFLFKKDGEKLFELQ